MRVTFSTEERLAIFQLFEQTPWGGDEPTLLVRDDAYEALNLGEFEKLDPKEKTPAWATSQTAKALELRRDIADYLCRALVVPGQSRHLGRITARVVRRLRAALPAPAASKEKA